MGGINQTHILKVFGYSSIRLRGWILARGRVDKVIPYMSWGLYTATLLGVVMSLGEIRGQSFHKKPMLLVFLILMGGWPAGRIFTLKWLVLRCLISKGFYLGGVLLRVSSVVALPIYIGVLFSGLMHPSYRGERGARIGKLIGGLLGVSYFWVGLLA